MLRQYERNELPSSALWRTMRPRPRRASPAAIAHLTILETVQPDEVISQSPAVLATIHAGALVAAPRVPVLTRA